jgi:hypothetical protein
MRLVPSAFRVILLALAFALPSFIFGQTPDPDPNRTNSPVPTITFELTFAGARPAHYSFAVQSTGRTSYRSDDPDKQDQQPFITEFTLNERIARQIFDLAKKTHYFRGDFEFHGSNIANMGTKTFTYSEGASNPTLPTGDTGKQTRTSFNYTQNGPLQQLTTIFQTVSTTLEFGARLQQLHRYDRMGLEPELKRMEEVGKEHGLREVQAIAPILRDIANDTQVFNVTRQRAARLLRDSEAGR